MLNLDPVVALRKRVLSEPAAGFSAAFPVRFSRAPGRLDVMGGIADYTGSLVCEATLDRAAAVALQTRSDRQMEVLSFNLLDEGRPHRVGIALDELAKQTMESLRRELSGEGGRWSGYLVGCLFVLHEQGLIDLKDGAIGGFRVGLMSTVPLGAGVSSSAAIEVATMMALADHFGLRGSALDAMRMASLCQRVENCVVGAPCGIMDQVTSVAGRAHSLLRLVCQPHELQGALSLPGGIRVLGINSNVKHSVGGGMYGKTRCAAFMGHRMILEEMRKVGVAGGKASGADPMGGYLANLDPGEYKAKYRAMLPERMKGRDFVSAYGSTIDKATTVDPETEYHVRLATDHHVLEASRVREFVKLIEEARGLPKRSGEQVSLLRKAGELMYGSHDSYGRCAKLGAEECDLLVELVRKNEGAGLYGAKITGGGSGGTVAVLADESAEAEEAIGGIMRAYEERTGRRPEAFLGSSPGAWEAGTELVGG